MKSMKLIALIGLAAISLQGSELAHGQITKQGNGYLMRMKFTPGAVLKYILNIGATSPQSPKPMNMTMTMTQKIKSVKNGVATVEVSSTPVNGQAVPTQTVTVDSRGKTTGGAAGAGASTSTVSLPEGPIPIGGTWKGSLPGMQQGMAGSALYKLLSVKKINGKEQAEIGLSIQVSQGTAMKVTGSGKMFLYTADGSLNTMSMTMNMSMSNQGKTFNSKMTMGMRRG